MNITIIYWDHREVKGDLATAVQSAIINTNYDTHGVAEKAQEMTENAAQFCGNLTSLLVEKKILTLEEVKSLLPGFFIKDIQP